MGGYQVSWNTAEEQLLVENYFKVGGEAACKAWYAPVLSLPILRNKCTAVAF